MKISEYLQQEELEKLRSNWQYLTPLQRKILLWRSTLSAFPGRSLFWLDNYIHRRRARFAYWYPAHWM